MNILIQNKKEVLSKSLIRFESNVRKIKYRLLKIHNTEPYISIINKMAIQIIVSNLLLLKTTNVSTYINEDKRINLKNKNIFCNLYASWIQAVIRNLIKERTPLTLLNKLENAIDTCEKCGKDISDLYIVGDYLCLECHDKLCTIGISCYDCNKKNCMCYNNPFHPEDLGIYEGFECGHNVCESCLEQKNVNFFMLDGELFFIGNHC